MTEKSLEAAESWREILDLLPGADDRKRLPMRGTSMLPTLREGDWVEVAIGKQPDVGDIALCVVRGELIVHRVISRREDRWVLKGDNAPRSQTVSPEQVIGEVVRVERNGRAAELSPRSGRLLAALSRVHAAVHRVASRLPGHNTRLAPWVARFLMGLFHCAVRPLSRRQRRPSE
jgi:hypothetical protein